MKPDPRTFEEVLAIVRKGAAQADHFFRLATGDWLDPLAEHGFFRVPPGPENVEGGIRFPYWPESQFLARLADAPEWQKRVLDVTRLIPKTDNVRVQEDIADIALKLPADMALTLVDRISESVRTPYLTFLPEKAGALVTKFAQAGQTGAALRLARALLEPARDGASHSERPSGTVRARSAFDEHQYLEVLDRNVPDLVQAAPWDAFVLLSEMLADAMALTRARDADGFLDYSEIWRPSIEGSGRRRHDITNALVSAVRDAALAVCEIDKTRVRDVVTALNAREWPIFTRLATFVVSAFPSEVPAFVQERLHNKKAIDLWSKRAELRRLAARGFSTLSVDAQVDLLTWIDEGPDINDAVEWYKRQHGQEPSDEQRTAWRERWQRDRLSTIASHLPPEYRQRLEDLKQRHGPPEGPSDTVVGTGWVGPTSPLTREQLERMPITDIVQSLRDWVPESGWAKASPEGLGRTLAEVIAHDPIRFAERAHAFIGMNPTYVRSVVEGFRQAAKPDVLFPLEPVLALCAWVVAQRDPDNDGTFPATPDDADPDWSWSRRTIATFIDDILAGGSPSPSLAVRGDVWRVLEPLTRDPNPSPDYEAEYGGENMDPPTLALNSIRGAAMHAVFRYAVWVKERTESSEKAQHWNGLEDIPEVRLVLEEHLDPSVDPSLAVRAVYGQWLPWLSMLDEKWTVAHIRDIFNREPRYKALREAAWDTYVQFCRPYDNMLPILHEEYELSVNALTSETSGERPSPADTSLAEHLLVYYGRGQQDARGLVELLFERAEPKTRAHAIEFVGRSLHDSEDVIPTEVLQRFQLLWEQRLGVAIASRTPNRYRAELAAFGWWFSSAKFGPDWSLAQLRAVLHLVNTIEPAHLVVEQLALLAQHHPLAAVECLEGISNSKEETWGFLGWKADAKQLLRNVMATDDHNAQERAIALANALGARGFTEFRDVVSKHR